MPFPNFLEVTTIGMLQIPCTPPSHNVVAGANIFSIWGCVITHRRMQFCHGSD